MLLASKNMAKYGHPCSVVSLGSTPTIVHASHLKGITEVRCGVYMLWDLAQASKGICEIDDIAITVLASIIGHNHQENKILIDDEKLVDFESLIMVNLSFLNIIC